MALPTGADLQGTLAGAGLITLPLAGLQAGLDYDGAVAAAVEALEQVTGFFPWEASGTASGRVFDVPVDGWLDLLGGLVGNPTGVTVNGVPWVLDSSVFAYPRTALSRGRPYTKLRLGSSPTSASWEDTPMPQGLPTLIPTVVVTGRWGAQATTSAGAREAILARAALGLAPQLVAARVTGSLETSADELVMDDVEEWEESDPGGMVRQRLVSGQRRTASYTKQADYWGGLWQKRFDDFVKAWSRRSGIKSRQLEAPVGAGRGGY